MSFTVNKSDGTVLVVVPENEVVTNAAPVALIGRGATTYAEAHSENFVHLLENFAHTTAPANALEGQLWYDKNVSSLKVRKGNNWVIVGTGGDGVGSNVSGSVYVPIGDTSVMALCAGGEVIAVLSPANIASSLIPATLTLLSATIPLQSRFPFGLKPGSNLAYDPDDYTYQGHVPLADGALFTGGGSPFAATTFVDLGPTSVALSISNNAIIAAYSQAIVAQANIPTNFTVNGVTMPFKAVFPSGLVAGLTLGHNYGISTDNLNTGSDNSDVYTSLVNTFESATGQSSLASAIEYIVTTAGEGTSNAEAGTVLRAQFTDALGTSTFAEALSKLAVAANATNASASDLTALQSSITTAYTTAIATATEDMLTSADLNGTAAQVLTDLEASFETDTGYSTIAQAINDLKTVATGTGSVVTQDTDFRTQFTGALQYGETTGTINTVAKAMDKLKLFSTADAAAATRLNNIESAFKTLTGTSSQSSFATAANLMATTAAVNSAISSNNTTLQASIANQMNNGSSTISDAIAEIIQNVQAGAGGSSSVVDTNLRNSLIAGTNESDFPVATIQDAITKLMNNSPKDRVNASGIAELQGALTGATGTTTVANARTKLTSTVTKADSSATFITDLQSALVTETGQSTWSSAVDYLATAATTTGTTATKVTTIESAFLSSTGQSTVSGAISTLWSRANAAGSAAGWSLDLNSDGTIAGLELITDGTQKKSAFIVKADQFKIYAAGTPTIVPFEIVNNVVYIKTAVIGDLTIGTNKLADNSISVTGSVAQSGTNYGNGAYTVICSYDIILTSPATVFAIANGRQSYSNGVRSWAAGIFINGSQASFAGGGAGFTDSLTTSASVSLPAGTHTVTFQRQASDSTVSLSGGTLYVQGVYK